MLHSEFGILGIVNARDGIGTQRVIVPYRLCLPSRVFASRPACTRARARGRKSNTYKRGYRRRLPAYDSSLGPEFIRSRSRSTRYLIVARVPSGISNRKLIGASYAVQDELMCYDRLSRTWSQDSTVTTFASQSIAIFAA